MRVCMYVCMNHKCDVESALIQPRSPAARYVAGAIDIKELKSAMQSLGFDAKNHTVFQMIAELDQEGEGGSLDFDEFLHMMTAKMVRACLCVASVGGSVGLGPLTRRAEIEGRLNHPHPFFNPCYRATRTRRRTCRRCLRSSTTTSRARSRCATSSAWPRSSASRSPVRLLVIVYMDVLWSMDGVHHPPFVHQTPGNKPPRVVELTPDPHLNHTPPHTLN